MGWLKEVLNRDGEAVRVEKVEASRAVHTNPDLKERVEMRLLLEDGHKLTLDMNVDQAGELIAQLTIAHNAIQPPLRGSARA